MNANTPFERVLEGWLDATSADLAPDGLHADAMTLAKRTRQRPRWLTGLRGTIFPTLGLPVGRPAVRAGLGTRLAVAAVISVIAVGGALYLIQQDESAVGGPSPTPGGSPSPSPNSSARPPSTPSWTIIAGPAYRAGGFSATLLPDGKVLLAGGLGPLGFPDPAADELYDPATGSWVATGRMVYPRTAFSATLLANGEVLALGGGSSDAELYDPGTGSWTLTGGIDGLPRSGLTATLLIDGRVLVTGGTYILPNGNAGSLASAEVYDPVSGTWTTTGSMLTRRSGAKAALLPDGKVLVLGGDDLGSGTLASAEVYDPDTGTWSATGSMHEARVAHTATRLLDGRVLVGGGVTTEPDWGATSASAELYEPVSGSWIVTGRMTAARMYAAATLLSDGRVLVVGGLGSYRDGAEVVPADLYDAATGSWSATGSMRGIVGYTATLLPDGRVLVLGGGSSDNIPAAIYDPGGLP